MRKLLLTLWIALVAIIGGTLGSHGAGFLLLAGPGGGNHTALDASNQGTQTGSGTTCTAAVTTTQTNDFLVAYVSANSPGNDISAGATFSGGGLTWTSDASVSTAGVAQVDTLGYAVKAASGAITVTATLPATISFCTLIVAAISGANTAAPFDGAAVSGTTAPQSITTTNANDFIFAGYGTNSTSAPTQGACCTFIDGAQFQGAEYDKVTSTQSGVSIGTGNNDARAMIVRAIKSN